jgi:hypothetical protein
MTMSIQSKIIAACATAATLLVGASAEAGTTVPPIPEPSTWALMALGAVVVGIVARNKRK